MSRLTALAGVLAVVVPGPAVQALETRVELGAEGTYYTHPGPPQTHDAKVAASLRPEFNHELSEQNLYLTLEAFFRVDQYDEQRNHADFRELKALKAYDDWELEGGISQIFWGVAESNHLVDIINQTDMLEGIDGEDKLGQPLLRISRIFDQATLSAFILPGFRERAYQGPESRFSPPFEIDEDQARFESEQGSEHIDYAMRYGGYAGLVDYGLSWFKGTARKPLFEPLTPDGEVMVPYYQQIERVGLDLQYTVDAWLWKFEGIYQRSSQPSFSAYVGGLEYTLYNLQDSLYDLGLLAEYNHDSRGDPQRIFLQNDIFIGTRFAFTDAESSSILAGAFIDLDDASRIFRIEASRRVFSDATLSLEAQVFSAIDESNINYVYRDDDFVKLDIAWYF